MEQITLFDLTRPMVKIDKPIRLIEFFAGYGSQSMALRNLGVDYEMWKAIEIDPYVMASYNAVHGTSFEPTDIKNIGGGTLQIVDQDKYCYLVTYSFPCFTGDTMVLTTDGYKMISNIAAGDKVLTHDNTYKAVLKSMKTGRKQIYKIKGMCFDEIQCTENHKFYVRKMVRHYPTYENGKRGCIRTFNSPEWIECKSLDKSYYMGIAINNKSIIPTWDGITHIWHDGRKPRHKNNLSQFMDNKDFWWLIGRYVGDGWHRSQGGIIICAAKNETTEITTVADKLGIKYIVVNERTVDKIHFADSELELFVEPFGRGAGHKKIPGFVFDLPKELTKAFVDGYVSADGSFTQNLYKTSSVSRELSYGIAHLVAKSYNTPFSIYKNERKPKSIIEGRIINQKTAYQVTWKTERRKQDRAFYEDGYVWFPIQSIVKTDEIKDVYDIEVEDNHSFTANGVIVHNCTDISLAGQQAGMSKDSGTRSSLLWEVERILNELKEMNTLPDILVMENVTAIHNEKNRPDFAKWLEYLDGLGYSTYVQDLNAWDFGVAQSRDRTFAVSILGDYNYKFPEPIDLKYCIEDYYEDLTEEQALQLVVKSPKALELLERLDSEGKLEED